MGAIPKQQIERIFITVILIVAIFFGSTRFRKGSTEKRLLKEDFDAMEKDLKALESEWFPKTERFEYIASELRDPFKSPLDEKPKDEALEKVELPKMSFQGMVFGSRLSQVIIDNKVYRVGETVNEVEITGITKEGVHLKYKGKEFIVRPK